MNDLTIAKKYITKANNARQLKHDFDLTFVEFKRMMLCKKCAYSGLLLVDNEKETFHSRTIDRVDNSKGYMKGNVKAVAYGINMLKATFENPLHPMTIDIFLKTAKNIKKLENV